MVSHRPTRMNATSGSSLAMAARQIPGQSRHVGISPR